eukprot:Nk52_evm97s224 gene=Nk52_evmTU97s224
MSCKGISRGTCGFPVVLLVALAYLVTLVNAEYNETCGIQLTWRKLSNDAVLSSTHPGERSGAMTWTTSYGIFLYGGYVDGVYTNPASDQLWLFEFSTQQWKLLNDPGGAGTQSDVNKAANDYHADNTPGSRASGCAVMSSAEDDLYLIGGKGRIGGTDKDLMDVWSYNVGQQQWKNLFYDATGNQDGDLGAGKRPSSRSDFCCWSHEDNGTPYLYLFGGRGYVSGVTKYLNDVWSFNVYTSTFEIEFGSLVGDQLGDYSATGYPGGRYQQSCAAGRAEGNEEVFIYGGQGMGETNAPSGTGPYLADLWGFNFKTITWTHLNGVGKEPGVDAGVFDSPANVLKATAKAYYSFDDGTANNQNSASHHGTLSASPPVLDTGRFGVANTAFKFDETDTNQWILLDSSVTNSNTLSICGWFKRNGNYDTGLNYIVGGGDGAVFLGLNGHSPVYGGRGNQPSAGFVSVVDILDTDWHHLCGTNDGSTLKLYCDGVQIGLKSFSGTYSGVVGIGHDKNTVSDRTFDGTIDEVVIFDYALTDAEVVLLSEESGQPPPQIDQSQLTTLKGLAKAYYSFDDGTPNNQNSASHHGTLSSSPPVLDTGRFGVANTAYKFDETDNNQWILLDSSVTNSNTLTVCSWFKRNGNYDSGMNYILAGDSGAVYLAINAQSPQYGGRGNQPSAGLSTSPDILDTNWHHLCGTNDGSILKIYYDGKLLGTKSFTGTYTGVVGIGHDKDLVSDRTFDGTIDEVIIYDYALTETDIILLASEAGEVTSSSSVSSRPGGIVLGQMWIDLSYNLWLFGGNILRFDSSVAVTKSSNTLWMKDLNSTDENWKWMAGGDAVSQPQAESLSVGTLNTPDTSAIPAARHFSATYLSAIPLSYAAESIYIGHGVFDGSDFLGDLWSLESTQHGCPGGCLYGSYCEPSCVCKCGTLLTGTNCERLYSLLNDETAIAPLSGATPISVLVNEAKKVIFACWSDKCYGMDIDGSGINHGPLAGVSEIVFVATSSGIMYGLDDNPNVESRQAIEIDFTRERGPQLALFTGGAPLNDLTGYIQYLETVPNSIQLSTLVQGGTGNAPGNFAKDVTLSNGTIVHWAANQDYLLFKGNDPESVYVQKLRLKCDSDFCLAPASQ